MELLEEGPFPASPLRWLVDRPLWCPSSQRCTLLAWPASDFVLVRAPRKLAVPGGGAGLWRANLPPTARLDDPHRASLCSTASRCNRNALWPLGAIVARAPACALRLACVVDHQRSPQGETQ